MIAAGMNDLAMRLGGLRVVHEAGEDLALFLMGVVVLGLLIWALSPPGGSPSARN